MRPIMFHLDDEFAQRQTPLEFVWTVNKLSAQTSRLCYTDNRLLYAHRSPSEHIPLLRDLLTRASGEIHMLQVEEKARKLCCSCPYVSFRSKDMILIVSYVATLIVCGFRNSFNTPVAPSFGVLDQSLHLP